MRKIPKYIKIGGHRIKIEQYKNIIKDKKGKGTYWGLCLHAHKIIKLHTDMAWSNVEQVFLHEVIHEVSLQRDARLTERQVRRMSEGLYEFFKTNEALLREMNIGFIYYAEVMIYAVIYTFFILLVSNLIFREKEM